MSDVYNSNDTVVCGTLGEELAVSHAGAVALVVTAIVTVVASMVVTVTLLAFAYVKAKAAGKTVSLAIPDDVSRYQQQRSRAKSVVLVHSASQASILSQEDDDNDEGNGENWSAIYAVVPEVPAPLPAAARRKFGMGSRTSALMMQNSIIVEEEADDVVGTGDDDSGCASGQRSRYGSTFQEFKRSNSSHFLTVPGVAPGDSFHTPLQRSGSQEMVDVMNRFLFTTEPVEDVIRRSNSTSIDSERRRSSAGSTTNTPSNIKNSNRKMSISILESLVSPSKTPPLFDEEVSSPPPLPSVISSLSGIGGPKMSVYCSSAQSTPLPQKRRKPKSSNLSKKTTKKLSTSIAGALGSLGNVQVAAEHRVASPLIREAGPTSSNRRGMPEDQDGEGDQQQHQYMTVCGVSRELEERSRKHTPTQRASILNANQFKI